MKSPFLIIVALASLLILSAASAFAGKNPWASFGVGSWATYRTVRVDGSGPEMLTRFQLVAIDSKAATVEIEVDMNGKTSKTQVQYEIPYNRPEKAPQKDETLQIAGRTLVCHVVHHEKENVRIWNCEKVPGFMVQTISATAKTTLVGYKVK